MKAKAIIGGVLTAGLLFAGCGGPGLEAEESSNLESREDPLPYCGNQSYWIDYYSDATYTTWVGYRSCECYETGRVSGRTTQYAVTDFMFTCS